MKNTLKAHANALEASFLGVMVTASLLALPLFAEQSPETTGMTNEYYAQHIVKLFEKVGAESSGAYDNNRIETSAFDFVRYASHTCFHPAENDLAGCKEEFGPYADLQSTQANGTLSDILKKVPYLKTASALVPTLTTTTSTVNVATVPTVETPTTTTVYNNGVAASAIDERKGVDERSKVLWALCTDKYSADRGAASRCYQRNIRRTMIDTRLPEAENVF